MNSLCNTLTYILLTMFVVMPLPAQDFSVQVMQPEKNYFVLVMDKSASMYGERIKNARAVLLMAKPGPAKRTLVTMFMLPVTPWVPACLSMMNMWGSQPGPW